jgi:endonuclease/exonuclease/phosphatase (EEP) superfamily protein YafD
MSVKLTKRITSRWWRRCGFCVLSLLLCSILLLNACVSVSPQAQTIDSEGNVVQSTQACTDTASPQVVETSLNTNGFSLSSWNIYKQSKIGWQTDLRELSRHSDVLVLQEVSLQNNFKSFLEQQQLAWEMTPGFYYRGIPAGVMTAAKAGATAKCSQLYFEPYTLLPKAVLLTYFPLSDSDKSLLVVNVHGVNFTFGTDDLQAQLDAAKAIMVEHEGPLILAGDFNTWSEARLTVLQQKTKALGMLPVTFEGQQPAYHMGQVVDHIYYRGLVALGSEVTPVLSSDHYPLTVRFRLI